MKFTNEREEFTTELHGGNTEERGEDTLYAAYLCLACKG
jgi:hypothetical protein